MVEPISAEALKYYPSEEKSEGKKSEGKESEKKKELSEMEERVLEVMPENHQLLMPLASDNLGISETSVYTAARGI